MSNSGSASRSVPALSSAGSSGRSKKRNGSRLRRQQPKPETKPPQQPSSSRLRSHRSKLRLRLSSAFARTLTVAAILLLSGLTSTACQKNCPHPVPPVVEPCQTSFPPPLISLRVTWNDGLTDAELLAIRNFLRDYAIYRKEAERCEKWLNDQ